MTDDTKAKEAEQILMQFQFQNKQLESLLVQKQSLEYQKAETDAASKELEGQGEFFKIVGPIIVKKARDDLKKEIDDRKEEIELMLKSIEKNEKKVREMIEKTREKLQNILPQLQGQEQAAGPAEN